MADQTFAVSCGFFDSVDNDRLYSADEMNRPYKRLISNGVFATPQGTPSTDLQVVSGSAAMGIVVNAGEGIFTNKWFSNPAAINITVPSNTGLVPRRDSVIVQVDTRQSGRVGNIVYRTGTPSQNPVPPNIGTVNGVTEYRIANIYVAAGATAINQDAIVDLRGSSECPWVTSLVYQVDTSTLFAQWQAAYQNYYDQSTDDFEEYTQTQRTEWENFLSSLTEDLTVETNLITLTNTYIPANSMKTIPIGISSYDPDTDILQVYVNGLRMAEGVQYTVSSNGQNITLKSNVLAGQTVLFVVMKSVITGEIATVTNLIDALDTKLSKFMSDSGWINFILESGATAYDSTSTPGVRCTYNRIYLRGAVKNVTATGTTICTLPVAYRPAQNHIYTSAAIYNGSVVATVVLEVSASDGTVKLIATSGTIPSGALISIATNFVTEVGSGYNVASGSASVTVTNDDDGNVIVTHS